MDLDTIKETITFLGSSGAILFIPKLYLDYKKQKRLQEDQLQNNKVLQEEQHRLNKELSILKAKQDNLLFISNKQYEKEFEIYLDVYEKVSLSLLNTKSLADYLLDLPINKTSSKVYTYASTASASIDESIRITNRYKPFMTHHIYSLFRSINMGQKDYIESIMGEIIGKTNSEIAEIVQSSDYDTKMSKLLFDENEVSNSIKYYLDELKIK